MFKIFVEYQILPQHRPVYSQWIQMVRDKCPELELLEGVDQPGLFIEVWNECTRETYLYMKQIRGGSLSQPANLVNETAARYSTIEWQAMEPWIQGGASKLHIWHFKKS